MMYDKAIIISEYEDLLRRKGRKPSTINLQISVIKGFIKKGYNLESYKDYNKFLEDHTIKKRSTYYYDTLISFVKWYFKDKKEIKNLILDTITLTKKQVKDPIKKTILLSEEEQMNIIKSFKTPKHALIAWIQKETGVRAGDVIRLKRDNIKYSVFTGENESILIIEITFLKKGERVQKIPIFNPRLIEYIKERLMEIDGEEDYVFIDRDVVNKGNQDNLFKLERRNYYLYWKELQETIEKCGYDKSEFSTHDWRRNFADNVWVNILGKRDIVALQRALGHAHADTTIRYLRHSGLESQDIFKKKYEATEKSWNF